MDLSSNRLRGINALNRGTHTSEVIQAIADALRVNVSLTECDLCYIQLGERGWCTVFDALRDNPQNRVSKWTLSGQNINPTITKSLSAYVAVSPSLTEVLAFLPVWPRIFLCSFTEIGYEFLFVSWRRLICLTTSYAALI